ncbi:response regulator transcription factor [Lentzea sp. PSKA42]|uniref:Response regulator transcription factor n=1 Tax=Lentzea indica TaxID=2604800 RepID=A0ABX1FSZ9_9PSEU|nr:response regulator transcription factor [Lentzea indica]NKE61954.1 response regulator transcription factor [Lentzea indica]
MTQSLAEARLGTCRQNRDRQLRVALVDSVPLLRSGVQTVVAADPSLTWIGGASGAPAAVEMCDRGAPDAVLITSGGDPGWKLCELLTRLFNGMIVVVLIGPEARSAEAMARARLHGARSLVPIEADSDRLVTAIRLGVDLGDFIDPQLRGCFGPVRLSSVVFGGKPLSRRELEVLQQVAKGRTAVEIAGCLGIGAETVRTHVNHVLRKLEARDRAHAVAKAFEMSLLSR